MDHLYLSLPFKAIYRHLLEKHQTDSNELSSSIHEVQTK